MASRDCGRSWVEAELGGHGTFREQRIVGGQQSFCVQLTGRIDDLRIEKDIELPRCLHECRVALRDDAAEQADKEEKPEKDRSDAVELETAFGGIAALDAALMIRPAVDRTATLAPDGFDGHHSYCSRYLRTM